MTLSSAVGMGYKIVIWSKTKEEVKVKQASSSEWVTSRKDLGSCQWNSALGEVMVMSWQSCGSWDCCLLFGNSHLICLCSVHWCVFIQLHHIISLQQVSLSVYKSDLFSFSYPALFSSNVSQNGLLVAICPWCLPLPCQGHMSWMDFYIYFSRLTWPYPLKTGFSQLWHLAFPLCQNFLHKCWSCPPPNHFIMPHSSILRIMQLQFPQKIFSWSYLTYCRSGIHVSLFFLH